MENTRKFPLILSSFWIKIIALVTMTIDHIGFMLPEGGLYTAFRIIGRIAFPLFAFMIAEGAIHTKSFSKYALRLGIMASAISLGLIINEILLIDPSLREQGNIFIDLLLGAFAIYLLRQDKWYIKVLAILPILFSVYSFIGSSFEACGCHGKILWCPFFLRTQYGWFGVLLIVLYYLAHYCTKLFVSYLSSLSGMPLESYKDSNFERIALNIFSVIMLVITSTLLYVVGTLMPSNYVGWMQDIQFYAIIAGAFILLYNGRRGYNKKWFQYGSYLYYPVHLLVIYLVYLLTLISF